MEKILILHFTKPKLQSQGVYVLIPLKLLGSYVVLYSAFSHLLCHGQFLTL